MSKKSQSTQLQCRFTSNPLLTSCIYYFLMFLTLLLVFDFTSIYLFVISLPFILFPPSFSPSINFSFSIYLPVKTLKNSRKSHPHTHTIKPNTKCTNTGNFNPSKNPFTVCVEDASKV